MTAVADPSAEPIRLDELERCFSGGIPAVLATASADGIPNVTYLSRAHQVDGERIALSNQFMSKTARNLAVNPRASLLLVDPVSHDEYRLLLHYERTERRGPVFERLRADVDALAAQVGMRDVFRLRAADVFRVLDIDQIPSNPSGATTARPATERPVPEAVRALGELAARLDRATDLDIAIDVAAEAVDEVLGYEHGALLLLDEEGTSLYVIAGRGFEDSHLGAEVRLGEGLIGMAAARCETQQMTGLRQLRKYSHTVRRAFEEGGVVPGVELPMPGLPDVDSRLVVPLRSLGELVGVLVVESAEPVAFDGLDARVLEIAGALIGSTIVRARSQPMAVEPVVATPPPVAVPPTKTAPSTVATAPTVAAPSTLPSTETSTLPSTTETPPPTETSTLPSTETPPPSEPTATRVVRFFEVDGSTFVDGDYLIKGVAGRILWSLLTEHDRDGRTDFTNRELRLDRSLGLPGFKDNLESRLVLLKRRLDERGAPIRIDRTGRGRFRLTVSAPLRLVRDDP